jgi:hypothetical protein
VRVLHQQHPPVWDVERMPLEKEHTMSNVGCVMWTDTNENDANSYQLKFARATYIPGGKLLSGKTPVGKILS